MKLIEFKNILNKIKDYTDYLYFHVLGEPLMHPNINEFIDYASQDFKINITTNGYLINRIKDNKNIRQINISLHSFDDKYKIPLEKYMNNIFDSINILKENTYISFRLWVNNDYNDKILELINKKYNKNIKIEEIKKNVKIDDNIFLSFSREFIWPDLNNNYYNEDGTCYALKDHIGILVDGTIVPCCLDTKGIINLGNINNDNLNDILNSERCLKMINNFKQNKKCEELCKKCKFL